MEGEEGNSGACYLTWPSMEGDLSEWGLRTSITNCADVVIEYQGQDRRNNSWGDRAASGRDGPTQTRGSGGI